MSRAHPLIAIIQLFESGPPVRSAEDIGGALGMPVSTTYRHIRALVDAGLLDPVSGGGYALGPGFIRYDRVLRQSDPLLRVAEPIMKTLLQRTSRQATVILCRRFRDCVMCVHEVRGDRPHPPTSYERGVAMPMFLGATSKAILAHLPDRTLKNVYLANEETIRRTLKVKDWKGFKDQFRAIRRSGYALTDSEIAKGRIGLAAPIFRGSQVVCAISLVALPSEAERTRIERYIPLVVGAAAEISKGLSGEPTIVSR